MNIIKLILAAIGLYLSECCFYGYSGFCRRSFGTCSGSASSGLSVTGATGFFARSRTRPSARDQHTGIGTGMDIPMSWDEYDKKYLHK